MYILNGSTSKTVAKDLSLISNFPIVKTIIKRFPDGELYIRILDDVTGEDLIILQNTYPDQNIIELFLNYGQSKAKLASFTMSTFNPYLSVMCINYIPAYR